MIEDRLDGTTNICADPKGSTLEFRAPICVCPFLPTFIIAFCLLSSLPCLAQGTTPNSAGDNATSVPGDTNSFEDSRELGPVTVTTRLTPVNARIGDMIELVLEVRSEEGVEVLMPEFGDVISGFAISQYLPKKQILPDGRMVQSLTYQFQVVQSGKQVIQPIGIEFVDNRPGQKATPDEYDAYELETERINFDVASVLVQGAATDLKPPLPELAPIQDSRSSSFWLIVFASLTLLLLAIILILYLRSRREEVRKVNAYEIARKRLDRLLADRSSARPSIDAEQFFVEISSLIRKYLEDRFSLRAPELTTDEFLKEAAVTGELTAQHQDLLSEFLRQADMVKFAGVNAGQGDIDRSAQLAQQFLEDTRINAPDVMIHDDSDGAADAVAKKLGGV